MKTRSEKFRMLQRKVVLYEKRGTPLKTREEKLMYEYIKKSRELKSGLDLIAAQIEILFE